MNSLPKNYRFLFFIVVATVSFYAVAEEDVVVVSAANYEGDWLKPKAILNRIVAAQNL